MTHLDADTRLAVALLAPSASAFYQLAAAWADVHAGIKASGALKVGKQQALRLIPASTTSRAFPKEGLLKPSCGSAAASHDSTTSQAVLDELAACAAIDPLRPDLLPRAACGAPPGTSPLLHFAYKSTARLQCVVSQFPPHAASPQLQQVCEQECVALTMSTVSPQKSAGRG